MPHDALVALCLFALVSSITPGPSNFMLLTSGANFGFRRTLPLLLGIAFGFGALLLGLGLGLGALIAALPALHLALKFAGAAWLLYLAWRIGTARGIGAGAAVPQPVGFLESAAFQWINPKAWVAALSAMAVFTRAEAPFLSTALIALVFSLAILPSLVAWAGFGMALRGALTDERRLRVFNLAMGLLLAGSLWPMLR
ncbi:LysE family translocator [Falsiroseomonas sp.]|uniref:LysE family translocator n=1 Tax=Falsiroseomonas sp. TaxID=2870721 RepID=UPI003564D83D